MNKVKRMLFYSFGVNMTIYASYVLRALAGKIMGEPFTWEWYDKPLYVLTFIVLNLVFPIYLLMRYGDISLNVIDECFKDKQNPILVGVFIFVALFNVSLTLFAMACIIYVIGAI